MCVFSLPYEPPKGRGKIYSRFGYFDNGLGAEFLCSRNRLGRVWNVLACRNYRGSAGNGPQDAEGWYQFKSKANDNLALEGSITPEQANQILSSLVPG